MMVQMPEYTAPEVRGIHGKEGIVIVNSGRLEDFLKVLKALP